MGCVSEKQKQPNILPNSTTLKVNSVINSVQTGNQNNEKLPQNAHHQVSFGVFQTPKDTSWVQPNFPFAPKAIIGQSVLRGSYPNIEMQITSPKQLKASLQVEQEEFPSLATMGRITGSIINESLKVKQINGYPLQANYAWSQQIEEQQYLTDYNGTPIPSVQVRIA